MPGDSPRVASQADAGDRLGVKGRGSPAERAACNPSTNVVRPWVTPSSLSPEEQIRLAREQYEDATDFTVAVEEEFAILDPGTLALSNRFEELQAAAAGTPLEPHLVGELIASEVEVRTGRCDSFDELAARIGERRTQLQELADSLGMALGRDRDASLEPLAGPADHRHAALPPQRPDPPATSSGATTASASTCTWRSAAPIARSPSATSCATSCPSCSRSRRARPSSKE